MPSSFYFLPNGGQGALEFSRIAPIQSACKYVYVTQLGCEKTTLLQLQQEPRPANWYSKGIKNSFFAGSVSDQSGRAAFAFGVLDEVSRWRRGHHRPSLIWICLAGGGACLLASPSRAICLPRWSGRFGKRSDAGRTRRSALSLWPPDSPVPRVRSRTGSGWARPSLRAGQAPYTAH